MESSRSEDLSLPARRAASRIRSEFPALEAYDARSVEELSMEGPPKVCVL